MVDILTYLPDVPIYVVDGTPENMKVTEPIDVHIADKLFQLQSASLALDSLPDLADKVVVVFGGSYGIGHAVVELARDAGAQVFAHSRSTTDTDVRSTDDVRAALQHAHDEAGRVDVVIVTAGILRVARLVDATEDEIEDTIRTNLVAPALIAREAYAHLAETSGQVIFFTSSSYTRGRANYSTYSATKAGVVNLTQALAEEWAPAGVRVNCINPQRTNTPMRTDAFGAEPLGSLLDPADVARITLNVAASDLTGQIVTVNVAQFAGGPA